MAKKHIEILYFPKKDHTRGGDGKRPHFPPSFLNPSLIDNFDNNSNKDNDKDNPRTCVTFETLITILTIENLNS